MIWGTPCVLHVKTAFAVVGFVIQLGSISTIVSLFLITFMLVRRYLQTQRKRDQWKAEIEQARQVQHVLIPDELPRIAGFTIESEYRPARDLREQARRVVAGRDSHCH